MSESAFASAVAELVVRELREALDRKPHALLCPSAGRTVKPVYALLRSKYSTALDWSRVVCVQMDEYEGVGCLQPNSFSAQLFGELVAPLSIGQYLHFNGSDGALQRSLRSYEDNIANYGGIDVSLHGVGINGHVGFNEPWGGDMQNTRKATLHGSTKVSNEVSFDHAYTLGMRVLVQARTSIVAISGSNKRSAAQKFVSGVMGPEHPVSMLRAGRSVFCVIDELASPF